LAELLQVRDQLRGIGERFELRRGTACRLMVWASFRFRFGWRLGMALELRYAKK
jgi:hypothetical protein